MKTQTIVVSRPIKSGNGIRKSALPYDKNWPTRRTCVHYSPLVRASKNLVFFYIKIAF